MVLILTLKGVRHLISPRWLEEVECFSLSPGRFNFLLSHSRSPIVHAMATNHADKLTGKMMQSSQSGLHICKAKASPCY